MRTFFREVCQIFVPHRDVKHGPLPLLLIALTLVTGLVDAFSYLVLGHVFVANMTGNVVFLAFAVAGATGFSIPASLLALGSFVLGSFAGGFLGSRPGLHRGHLLSIAAALQTLLLVISAVLAALIREPVSGGLSYGLIIVLGIAMGLQNATVRKLAVPDLTTTVLTLTIVGLAADSRLVGGSGSRAGRRLMSVVAMLVGAIGGSLLIFHVSIISPLLVALLITAITASVTWVLARTKPAWVHAS